MLLGEREWKDERERESKKLSVGLDENKRKKYPRDDRVWRRKLLG